MANRIPRCSSLSLCILFLISSGSSSNLSPSQAFHGCLNISPHLKICCIVLFASGWCCTVMVACGAPDIYEDEITVI